MKSPYTENMTRECFMGEVSSAKGIVEENMGYSFLFGMASVWKCIRCSVYTEKECGLKEKRKFSQLEIVYA